ncbi:hypothetical protein [Streptomyces canus]|uniref:hypothetical protein n=1 Tax=Streptomyces canus TaxID=58343 RepID=UPI0037133B31
MTSSTDLTLAKPFTLGDLTLRNRRVATARAIVAVGAGMMITGGAAVATESTLAKRYRDSFAAHRAAARWCSESDGSHAERRRFPRGRSVHRTCCGD